MKANCWNCMYLGWREGFGGICRVIDPDGLAAAWVEGAKWNKALQMPSRDEDGCLMFDPAEHTQRPPRPMLVRIERSRPVG